MAPARLAWSLLPLVAASLLPWSNGASTFPARTLVPLTAAIVLTHPAHLPAAVTLVVLAALSVPGRGARLIQALRWLAVAALLTAFWTVPLLARLADTRALAWATLTPAALGQTVGAHPLVVLLVILAVVAIARARDGADRVLAWWPWASVVVALDALVLEPLGARWPPADRVRTASGWRSCWRPGSAPRDCSSASPASGRSSPPPSRSARCSWRPALSVVGHETLALSARAGAWPSYPATERGLRLPALWATLRTAPAGRVLFVRSGVPLVYGVEWWRPHTHITALTPLTTGRAIVNGTFTHSSPVAALVYRGRTEGGAITELVERLDGHSLFGRPLDDLDAPTFNEYARRLGVSVVVGLDEDLPRLRALVDNRVFATRRVEPPFVLWMGPPATLPQLVGRRPLADHAGDRDRSLGLRDAGLLPALARHRRWNGTTDPARSRRPAGGPPPTRPHRRRPHLPSRPPRMDRPHADRTRPHSLARRGLETVEKPVGFPLKRMTATDR